VNLRRNAASFAIGLALSTALTNAAVAKRHQADTPKHSHHKSEEKSAQKRHRAESETGKKHHTSQEAASGKGYAHRLAVRLHEQHLAALQKRAHEKRLALREEHEHRVRLKHMSRAEKRELKAHDRRLAQIQAGKHHQAVLQRQHEERLAKLERAHPARAAKIRHEQKAQEAKAEHHHTLVATTRSGSRHGRKESLARLQHEQRLAAKLAAHNAVIAQQQAAHNARVAQQQAAHNARLAQRQAAYQARLRAHQKAVAEAALRHNSILAQRQAAHNARLAAQKARYVAMHGDDTAGRSITFSQTMAVGVPVKVITVDLNNTNVKVSAVMSRQGDGTSEPFLQMINRSNPNVAVTGTFFSLDNLKPVGDIVIDGSLVHFGGMGTALCVTSDNKAEMVSCEWGRHHDWSPYEFVVACGPRLLRRGRIVLDPHAERFKDRNMLAPNSRIAVGITQSNKLVFAMTRQPIYLGRLAKAMRGLGCTEAMNLDAGTSTGFYYNGTTLARPGRRLTNMIVVYGSKARYEKALDQLVPPPYRRGKWFSSAHRQVSSAR